MNLHEVAFRVCLRPSVISAGTFNAPSLAERGLSAQVSAKNRDPIWSTSEGGAQNPPEIVLRDTDWTFCDQFLERGPKWQSR